ncbi:hypothetical protein [Desulfovibrio gilichinskyi]|uniref:Uncharacterized protein n=1 Tax=Desulfovibrio gilichinskyi TaxID=1519643 RepID=A0A1X7C394_9BACT|nr:hypothetical protein [Desulfovibrio gilichinskyi]SME89206.1 hypothetical protein SAMN06295933_0253 [Desulfovibrio gilichinskyi]
MSLELRRFRDTKFSVDSKGRLKNTETGNYIQPARAGRHLVYNQLGGLGVKTLMSEVWKNHFFTANKAWLAETVQFVAVKEVEKKKALKESIEKRKHSLEWVIIEKCPTYEMSERGTIRRIGEPATERGPQINQKGYAYFHVKANRKRIFIAQSKAYLKAFGKDLPGTVQIGYINPNEFNFKCPYERGIIETGYGNGKPDAQFSPLDWYHQELPEAVMIQQEK